tara:strand:- start:21080 stop:25588 length:4509 start_codon:yes stop_codon:yes gene_type:complete
MDEKQLRIQKLLFEINYNKKKDYRDFNHYLDSNSNRLEKILEEVFTDLGLKNLTIQNIEIDLENFNLKNFTSKFKNALINALKDKKFNSSTSLDNDDNEFYFIQHGYFPWWHDKNDIIKSKKSIDLNIEKINNLSKEGFIRFFSLKPHEFFKKFIKNKLRSNYEVYSQSYKFLNNFLKHYGYNKSILNKELFFFYFSEFFIDEITDFKASELLRLFLKKTSSSNNNLLNFLILNNEKNLFSEFLREKFKNNKSQVFDVLTKNIFKSYFETINYLSITKKKSIYELSKKIRYREIFIDFLKINKFNKNHFREIYQLKSFIFSSYILNVLNKILLFKDPSAKNIFLEFIDIILDSKELSPTQIFSKYLDKLSKIFHIKKIDMNLKLIIELNLAIYSKDLFQILFYNIIDSTSNELKLNESDLINFRNNELKLMSNKVIYYNQQNIKSKISELIAEMKKAIRYSGDMAVIGPIIKDLVDKSPRKDESLIEMAAITQRMIDSKDKRIGEEGFLSDKEKERLLIELENAADVIVEANSSNENEIFDFQKISTYKSSLQTNSKFKNISQILFKVFKYFIKKYRLSDKFTDDESIKNYIEFKFLKRRSINIKEFAEEILKEFSEYTNIELELIHLYTIQEYVKNKPDSIDEINIIEKIFFKLIRSLDFIKSTDLILTFSKTKILDNTISILLTHNKISEFNLSSLIEKSFLIRNISDKTFINLLNFFEKKYNVPFLKTYNDLSRILSSNKLKEQSYRLKFIFIKAIVKKEFSDEFYVFLKNIFEEFFLLDINYIEDEIKKIEAIRKTTKSSDIIVSFKKLIKKRFYSVILNEVDFEILLTQKKSNLNSKQLIDFLDFDNINDIIDTKDSFYKFIDFFHEDDQLFYYLVDISFEKEYEKRIKKLIPKRFFDYEDAILITSNIFSYTYLDRKLFKNILRSYLLKTSSFYKDEMLSLKYFAMGFFSFLNNKRFLNLNALIKFTNTTASSKKSFETNSKLNQDFKSALQSIFILFSEINMLSSIPKVTKEKIYDRDLITHAIIFNENPFWSKNNISKKDQFIYLIRSIKMSSLTELYEFFSNKKFIRSLSDFIKVNNTYEDKFLKAVKVVISKYKKVQAIAFSKKINNIRSVKKFLESSIDSKLLLNKEYEFDYKKDKSYQLNYFLNIGSLDNTFEINSIKKIESLIIFLLKKEKEKTIKIFHDSFKDLNKINIIVDLSNNFKRLNILEIIHQNLPKKYIELKKQIKKNIPLVLNNFKKQDDQIIIKMFLKKWTSSSLNEIDIEEYLLDFIENLNEKISVNNIVTNTPSSKYLIKLLLKSDFKNKTQELEKNEDYNNDEEILNYDKSLISLNNSGLIILWPYLYTLCEKLNYMKNKKFINDEDQNRAVMLSQYLVTGSTTILEEDIVLNKILFGLRPNKYVDCKIELKENELQMCDLLLNSVLQNWPQMSNTQVETFRESFLKREGVLNKTETDDYELTVKKESFDVILETIPWNINRIQTIFMKNKITVEWY